MSSAIVTSSSLPAAAIPTICTCARRSIGSSTTACAR
jgi:hypothetical protein